MAFIKRPSRQGKSQSASASGRGRLAGKFRRSELARKKVCRFCADKIEVNYKNISMLRSFVTEKGKMLSGRITGTCAKHQRRLDAAVKRARMLALLPFTIN